MNPILQRYLNVRRGELLPILLAALYFFCILTALMVLRPAREALGIQRGIEAVRWLFMGTLLVTLAVNPLFGFLVSRFRRMVFIAAMHGIFAVNLLVFWALLVLAPEVVGEISGLVFYIWMSVFNLFMTMLFWALMADRFSLEQSKRLFGVIAAGGTIGAIFGSWLAAVLAQRAGTPALLLIAVASLLLALLAAWGVSRLQPERARAAAGDPDSPPAVDERAIIGGSAWEGFRAAVRTPYLLGISGYVLVLTVLATFLYFTRLQMVAALGEDLDMRTGVFAGIDFIVQVSTLVLQLLIAGHVMKRLGVHVALALVPLIIALGYVGLAIAGSLAALIVFDAVFRATQRAIMRPARETLFTVVRREDKYKAKAFIDTFVYRGGDALGAQTEGLLARFGMGLTALASVAVPLALLWAALGFWLGRTQQQFAVTKSAIPLVDPARATG
ncbi:MAG TPA: MFS transporter [Thermoanaerobaculia bacterium]|nr:MFS transporter [Thermoanaerobaculia bacterium]